jgi:hypothetical protein
MGVGQQSSAGTSASNRDARGYPEPRRNGCHCPAGAPQNQTRNVLGTADPEPDPGEGGGGGAKAAAAARAAARARAARTGAPARPAFAPRRAAAPPPAAAPAPAPEPAPAPADPAVEAHLAEVAALAAAQKEATKLLPVEIGCDAPGATSAPPKAYFTVKSRWRDGAGRWCQEQAAEPLCAVAGLQLVQASAVASGVWF